MRRVGLVLMGICLTFTIVNPAPALGGFLDNLLNKFQNKTEQTEEKPEAIDVTGMSRATSGENISVLNLPVEGIRFNQGWGSIDDTLKKAGYSEQRGSGNLKTYTKQEGDIRKEIKLIKNRLGIKHELHINFSIAPVNHKTNLDNSVEQRRLIDLLGEPDGYCRKSSRSWQCKYASADKEKNTLAELTVTLEPKSNYYYFRLIDLPKDWKPYPERTAIAAAKAEELRKAALQRSQGVNEGLLDQAISRRIETLADFNSARELHEIVSLKQTNNNHNPHPNRQELRARDDRAYFLQSSSEARQRQHNRATQALDKWLTGAIPNEENNVSAIRSNDLEAMLDWKKRYETFKSSYLVTFPEYPEVRKVDSAYLEKRQDQLRSMAGKLEDFLARQHNSRVLDAAVSKYFDRDIDAQNEAGRTVWARIDARKNALLQQEEYAKYSRREHDLMADGGRIRVPEHYEAPTAEEIRLALIREYAGSKLVAEILDGHTVKRNDAPITLLLAAHGFNSDALAVEVHFERVDGFDCRSEPQGYACSYKLHRSSMLDGSICRAYDNLFQLTASGWRSPTERERLKLLAEAYYQQDQYDLYRLQCPGKQECEFLSRQWAGEIRPADGPDGTPCR